MPPQNPVLSVSYLQGPTDQRPNFEKFQNSGADEKIVIGHNSLQFSVFYPYLIRISTYPYAVHPKWRTDSFRGWSGGAMVLSKLPVPGRPTNLD